MHELQNVVMYDKNKGNYNLYSIKYALIFFKRIAKVSVLSCTDTCCAALLCLHIKCVSFIQSAKRLHLTIDNGRTTSNTVDK